MNVVTRRIKRLLPKDLLGRSLVTIIAPMIILQAVVAFVFMERYWESVTKKLSRTAVQELAVIADLYDENVTDNTTLKETEIYNTTRQIQNITAKLGYSITFNKGEMLPSVSEIPIIPLLHLSLSRELREIVRRPFWLNTTNQENDVDIRIFLADGTVMGVRMPRSRVYATNSHIFIIWMVVTSCILICIAVIFQRNQLKPIQRLAHAADALGKGQNIEDIKLGGATEIRRATLAFIIMKNRIDRHIQQRTNMLAGVSHDLRTPLTRFKLELAMLENKVDVSALRRDAEEMEKMLEAYLAFAQDGQEEQTRWLDLTALLNDVVITTQRKKETSITIDAEASMMISGRQNALTRCFTNIVSNGCDYGSIVAITAVKQNDRLTITLDDDGPGIPIDQRENVFRPFHKLDEARNQDRLGVGLGLTIARDIIRLHGGDIKLDTSPLGGLRVQINLSG
ncbi:MAG: ATP-binding protein [Parvularculales bacterium]